MSRLFLSTNIEGEQQAAWALNNGTDIEMGSDLYNTKLESAIHQGLTTQETVKQSVRRSLKLQFDVGRFDPLGDQASNPWAHITDDVINASAHQQALREAALQS
jgi:beta-glucosidase-like glycosyl hydrolase|eukprot:COSAG01_NODE_257_length_20101_cov_142.726427_19_plen_104_part_00